MNKRAILIFARLFFGLVTLAAIGIQLTISLGVGFSSVSFFSFFTNLSNVIVSLILIISAITLMRGAQPSPSDDQVRGAGVVYITVVGLVYLALLRGEDLGALLPWINTQLHIVMPIAVMADWLYQPPKSTLRLKDAFLWLTFPLVYLSYTLVRGAIINWYPYPFLNPALVGGYGAVALYCAAIAAAFFIISWVWIALGKRLTRNV